MDLVECRLLTRTARVMSPWPLPAKLELLKGKHPRLERGRRVLPRRGGQQKTLNINNLGACPRNKGNLTLRPLGETCHSMPVPVRSVLAAARHQRPKRAI
jgi:hypothetical protein